MFRVLNKQILANDVKRIDILAPEIAVRILPGQFVSVCPEEGDERIPLAVIDSDKNKKSISLIFQETGATTKKLGALAINDPIFSILGPLGVPATIAKHGSVVCIATGVGTAQILPIARAFKAAGNKVIGIVGAKTKRSLILESQLRILCDKIFITTDDGSYEKRGLPTDILKTFIDQKQVDLVYAIGSADMLEAVASMTKVKNIKTLVHVNPMMVDCMGMCGSCRVTVDGKVVLACVEGPEFDGHLIDYKDLKIRIKAYKEQDQWYNQKWKQNPPKREARTFPKFLSGILKK